MPKLMDKLKLLIRFLLRLSRKRSKKILGCGIQFLVKLFDLTGWFVMEQLNVDLMNWFMGMKLCCHGILVQDLGGYHSKTN
jgi:hypothetical protein